MSQSVDITWNGVQAARKVRVGAVRGLQLSTQLLLAEAVKIVPLYEGTLQDSGKATVDEVSLEGHVTFDSPYAVVQHERMDFIHPNGRQAKYLENPWRANAAKFAAIIAEQIRRELA